MGRTPCRTPSWNRLRKTGLSIGIAMAQSRRTSPRRKDKEYPLPPISALARYYEVNTQTLWRLVKIKGMTVEEAVKQIRNPPKPLTQRIVDALWLPSTSQELASTLKVNHRLVYASICSLKRQGRVIPVGEKREGARGFPGKIWGLPGVRMVGWLSIAKVKK